jgi:hypothetical protein
MAANCILGGCLPGMVKQALASWIFSCLKRSKELLRCFHYTQISAIRPRYCTQSIKAKTNRNQSFPTIHTRSRKRTGQRLASKKTARRNNVPLGVPCAHGAPVSTHPRTSAGHPVLAPIAARVNAVMIQTTPIRQRRNSCNSNGLRKFVMLFLEQPRPWRCIQSAVLPSCSAFYHTLANSSRSSVTFWKRSLSCSRNLR